MAMKLGTPHAIILFYLRKFLIITFNIYNGASIDPLNNLIVKAQANYNFKKSLYI